MLSRGACRLTARPTYEDFLRAKVNFEHSLGLACEASEINPKLFPHQREGTKRLPVTFMLLQPQSWHPDVWTDITRMLTLNGAQSAAGREMHLCPMQFDLADRVISQFTMAGETVFDPLAGLGTVPYRALKLKRKGIGVELSTKYFLDAVAYCKAAEQEAAIPDLFACEAAVGD